MVDDIEDVFKKCKSRSDVCRELNFSINGSGIRKVNELICEFNIDISHFDNGSSKKNKWKSIKKNCPICENSFVTQEGHPKEKTVCSHACSNVYFRTGEKNGNFKEGQRTVYRSVCFRHYPHKCLLCDWKETIEVHHLDENNKNNKISNLAPLCPNHHSLVHTSDHKKEILRKINEIKRLLFPNIDAM